MSPSEQPNDETSRLYPLGVSHFVSMTRGQIPLVLSTPHGGKEAPDWIPSLSSGPCVADKYTVDLTEALVRLIGKEMGGREPFAVYNKLHRCKMDANREPSQGTGGGLYATSVHQLYHDTLQQCVDEAMRYASNTTKQVLLIDIHGYAPLKTWNTTKWDSSWIMVGHLVSRKNLRSIKILPNEDWVRGPASLGSLLQCEGLLAEPSMQRPVPHAGKYFSGGYITARYRTTDDSNNGITVQTIQLELPRPMRNELGKVAHRMAKAIAKLMLLWEYIPSNESNGPQSTVESSDDMMISRNDTGSDDIDGDGDDCDDFEDDDANDDIVVDVVQEGPRLTNNGGMSGTAHSML